MSAVQQAAAAYLAARAANKAAAIAVADSKRALIAAEKALQEAVRSSGAGIACIAVVHGGVVIIFPEEYWERDAGGQLEVHRLAEATS